MQDVYCENCLFGLVVGLLERLGGEAGLKDWLAKLG